jgi:hypothetical protein
MIPQVEIPPQICHQEHFSMAAILEKYPEEIAFFKRL